MFTDKDLEELSKELSDFFQDYVHDKCDNPDEDAIYSFLSDKSKTIYYLKKIHNGR